MRLNKLSLVLTSAMLSSCLYAAEIDLKGKNLYIENSREPVYQICLETESPEEKITVNNMTDREVCVNSNPDLKFTVVNIAPEQSNKTVKFKVKVKETAYNNIPSLNISGYSIVSTYIGDSSNKDYTMVLDYQDLDVDTVITAYDCRYVSSKTSVNEYIIDKYLNY